MFRLFEGQTADEVWQKLALTFREEAGTAHQASRCGNTREILHAALSISDPRQRWVVSRRPAINPAFALAEVVWIMSGRNDSRFLNYFNSKLPRFAGQGQHYHGAYGYRLRRHLGIDQLERAYASLKASPQSRQVVLQIWDSKIDLPTTNGAPSAEDVPCNIISMLKIREGKLEWTQIMRSNDVFRGFPHNIVQFTAIQEVFAGWLGVGIGCYHQLSDSLHVYEDTYQDIRSSAAVLVDKNTDSLSVGKEESELSFGNLARCIESIIDAKTDEKQLIALVMNCKLQPGFKNILCILCAEGARRRRMASAAQDIMCHCSNAIYRQLFKNWQVRCLAQSG